MRKNSRHMIACFFSILMALPLFLILFLHIYQLWLQHESMEKMEQSMLQQVQLPEDELVWVKPGKEISIHGQLFDVKNITLQEGKYTVTGIFDDDETALKDWLYEKNQGPQMVISGLFLLTQSVVTIAWVLLTLAIIVFSVQVFARYSSDLYHYCTNILTPPPRLQSLLSA